jgi:hypothetical protein
VTADGACVADIDSDCPNVCSHLRDAIRKLGRKAKHGICILRQTSVLAASFDPSKKGVVSLASFFDAYRDCRLDCSVFDRHRILIEMEFQQLP